MNDINNKGIDGDGREGMILTVKVQMEMVENE